MNNLPFFNVQGQNPFESEEFSKTGSHLLESAFNFDCSARHGKLLLFLIQLFLRNQLEDLKFDKALSVIRDLTPIFTYFTFKDMGQITSTYFFLSLIKPLSVGVYS